LGADRRSSAAAEILVVDDDEPLCILLSDILENGGFRATVVRSGEEALAMLRTRRPAGVILDVRLPGLSGYEICREVRTLHGANVPIIFVSGERTESFDRVAGLLIGADDYLSKPFAPDELLARLRSLLRRRAAGPMGLERLTGREREVLGLLADGLDQRQIAAALYISPKTVGTHIERILQKLGVHSRLQAVALAYRDELAPTSVPLNL
jgi:two-component system nitrate/nitrite response regulator NarL